MKRLYLLVLSITLFFSTVASADMAISPLFLPSDDYSIQGVTTKPHYEHQTCALPVTVVYLNADGSEGSRNTLYISAYTITYKVVLNIADSGRIIGGSVSKGTELKLTASDSWTYDLNISISKGTDPQTSVTDQVDTYQIYVAGGTYTVTYNSTFYIDVNGSLDHVDRDTVTRSYYYVKTYNQPN